MRHHNAYYLDDRARVTTAFDRTQRVTIRGFVQAAGARQLVNVEWPDGKRTNVAFDSLAPFPWPADWADRVG